mmetsp:Transcript_16047/g.44017  ORF Transcript_16047/g.44017 Transcript_16047/m.44017 type:complete len:354 (-) Transcript_16047:39-1100(-)
MMARWATASFFLNITLVHGHAYHHRALAFDEFMEVVDMVSSVLYIVEAYPRAFGTDSGGFAQCDDGYFVRPVVVSECPLGGAPNPCSNSTNVSEICLGDGDCGTDGSLNNCPPFTPGIYEKTSVHCGEENCEGWAKALFTVALISDVLAIVVVACFPGARPYKSQINERNLVCGVRPFLVRYCCLGVLPSVGATMLVAWGVGTNWGRNRDDYVANNVVGPDAALRILVIVMLALLVAATVLNMWWLSGYGRNVSEEDLKLKRQLGGLNIPLFSMLVALYMTSETAEAVEKERCWQKWQLRIVQDIPQAVVAILDMCFFGVSWFAALDVAASVVMILVHLMFPINDLARRIAAP